MMMISTSASPFVYPWEGRLEKNKGIIGLVADES
jgi:hypothetical protein